jgi:NAD(P)H-quinone oxidoreductase subunit 6
MEPIEIINWIIHNMEVFMFYLLAVVAIAFSFGVLFDHEVIRSGFILIGVFGAISGLFLLLQAPFLALAQVMIYAVAITLVVVIALMLTNPKLEADRSVGLPSQKLPALISSTLLFLVIYAGIRLQPWAISMSPPLEKNVEQLGIMLLTIYALPFEFASILLLAALVGAVMLAKTDTSPPAVGAGDVAEPHITPSEVM